MSKKKTKKKREDLTLGEFFYEIDKKVLVTEFCWQRAEFVNYAVLTYKICCVLSPPDNRIQLINAYFLLTRSLFVYPIRTVLTYCTYSFD